MTEPRSLERFLVILGAAVCLIITIVIWRSLGAAQAMWPLPGLYFVEMTALSLLSVLAFVLGDRRGPLLLWVTAGILFAFSIVGAWSIGFFYLPVAVLLGAAAVLSDVRSKRPIAAHLGIFLATGLAQAVVMVAAIRLLYPSAVF